MIAETRDSIKGMKYQLLTLVRPGAEGDQSTAKDPLHKKLRVGRGEYSEMRVVHPGNVFRARLDLADKELPVKIEIRTKRDGR